MSGVRAYLDRIKAQITETTTEALRRALDAGESLVLLDVREADEVAAGHIPGALHVPRGVLELRVEGLIPDRARRVVICCAGGDRSALAARALEEMGYVWVESLAGGVNAWRAEGGPIEVPPTLSAEQRERYSRHMRIPQVGERGQHRLLSARALLVGAGGLGSPAAMYLAAAGVGTIGLIDDDVVDRSNLQRQILHTDARVGHLKVDSAQATLSALNPDVHLKLYPERLSEENAARILGAGWDVVLDGGDNFPTRYLVNDACVRLGIPCVHGSVYRFEGQLAVFAPHLGGPCYRCLHPSPPAPGAAPSCGEAGVLGVVPGVVGMLQANEAIKLLLGLGAPLVGRLALFDALGTTLRQLRLPADPACPVCGPHINPQDIALEATDPACAAR